MTRIDVDAIVAALAPNYVVGEIVTVNIVAKRYEQRNGAGDLVSVQREPDVLTIIIELDKKAP